MARIIGALLGLISAGFWGAIIGFFIGHIFSKAFQQFKKSESPEVLAAIQTNFFENNIHLNWLSSQSRRLGHARRN